MSVSGQRKGREGTETAPLQPLAVAPDAEAPERSVGLKETNLYYHVNRVLYAHDPIRY